MVECEGTCLMYMREMPRCHNSKRRMDLQSVQYSPTMGPTHWACKCHRGHFAHASFCGPRVCSEMRWPQNSSMLGMYSSTAMLGYGVGKKGEINICTLHVGLCSLLRLPPKTLHHPMGHTIHWLEHPKAERKANDLTVAHPTWFHSKHCEHIK